MTTNSDHSLGAAPPRPPSIEPQDAFLELGGLVVGAHPLGAVLTRVAELARASVPGAQEVSVTVLEGQNNIRTAAFTGSLAVHLDERQYEIGFGPCVDAAESLQVVRIEDTANDKAYPDFASIAAREGVQNIISVGMPMPQRILGAINVYRFEKQLLDDDAVHLLQGFAGYAAVAVANHSLYSAATALNGHLHAAMQSRAVIEQAKGVLMATLHCTADDAFAHLTRRSQTTNRKLREIAGDVVAQA